MAIKKQVTAVDDGKKLGIYAPWILFYRQIEALFEKDPEVSVSYNEETRNISVRVDNEVKADALTKLLPTVKVFGNVVVTVTVVPANESTSYSKLIKDAFEGNEAFSHLTTISEIPDMYISNPISYCVFKKEVVQYAADDLGTESGMRSTLYENLANDILGDVDGVYFCTDVK